MMYEKPYRIKPLRKALRHISDPKEAARLVGDVWQNSENIRQHRSVWLSIWTELADPWAAMDEKEQAGFATFPDRLTVFRGHCGRRGLTRGLAWTMAAKSGSSQRLAKARRLPPALRSEQSIAAGRRQTTRHHFGRHCTDLCCRMFSLFCHTSPTRRAASLGSLM